MKKISWVLGMSLWCGQALGQQLSLHDLYAKAQSQNLTLQNQKLQKELAVVTQKIAKVSAFNPRVPLSFQALDNLNLQRMYVPGPIFGQPEGTYKEFIMGQQYVSTFSVTPQFDILNFGAQGQTKSADINLKQTELSALSAERELLSQINTTFHNLYSFQWQEEIVKRNLSLAEEILTIVKNRAEEGIARVQEVNEAEVNVLTLKDQLYQMQQGALVQQELLKVLVQQQEDIQIKTENTFEGEIHAQSNLDTRTAQLKADMAKLDWENAKKDQWPVLSFVSSFSWQNLSNSFFYAPQSNNTHFSYVGLRLNWDLPSTPQKWSTMKNKAYQYRMAANEALDQQQKSIQADLEKAVEYKKAVHQQQIQAQIEKLKADTFAKNRAQFDEQILALDKLLQSQTDWLISELNAAKATVNVKYNEQIIRLNNQY